MDRYLKLSFDNVQGRNCKHCMLSFSQGEHAHCAGLENRPICTEEGCRDDCPLIDNVVDLPVIDASDDMYRQLMSKNNYAYANYGRNDYRDLFRTKSKKELLKIQGDINKRLRCIEELRERLFQKGEACRDILDKME